MEIWYKLIYCNYNESLNIFLKMLQLNVTKRQIFLKLYNNIYLKK